MHNFEGPLDLALALVIFGMRVARDLFSEGAT
jgi:hypothetical protein